jgi:alanyl-tRNA synthetase
VAAVPKGGEFNAGGLIADAARQVKGGGGRGDELAVAGGKEEAGLDGALDLVRAQLGLPLAPTAV